MEILFACDLDNTLIHSYKHRVDGDICVEYIGEKEQSFMSPKTYELLKEVVKYVTFVPLTTRSIEQFNRITWEEDIAPKYAVTTNGAMLFEKGESDKEWFEIFKNYSDKYIEEYKMHRSKLEEEARIIKCRIVDDRFLYAHFNSEVDMEEIKSEYENFSSSKVHFVGRKMYFLPENICKGTAVKELKEKLCPDIVICAGDSTMDLPMFDFADVAYAPKVELVKNIENLTREKILCCDENTLFAEFLLQDILEKVKDSKK